MGKMMNKPDFCILLLIHRHRKLFKSGSGWGYYSFQDTLEVKIHSYVATVKTGEALAPPRGTSYAHAVVNQLKEKAGSSTKINCI